MRRRALLATLATGCLAGCNGLGTDAERTTRPPLDVDTPTPTATAPLFGEPSVTPTPAARTRVGPNRRIVGLRSRDVPDGFSVVAGFVGDATDATPALLWVGLRNDSDEGRRLDLGGTPPVSDYRLTGGGQPLYVVPVARPEPTEGLRFWNDCWKTRTQWVVDPETTTRSVRIPPDGTVGGLYGVAVMRGANACLPTGQYELSGDGGWSLGLSVFAPVGTEPADSQFDWAEPPPLGVDGVDRTRWFHAAGAETRRYLEPSAEQVGLLGGDLRVALHNYGDGPVDRRGSWRLYRRHRDGWKRVAPVGPGSGGTTTVRPGQADGTRLELDGRPTLDHGDPETVGGLTPGRYAVAYPRVDVYRGATLKSTDCFVALVELVGDAPTLSPSSMVQETSRNGDTVDVFAAEDSGASSAVVVVERTPDVPARELVLSQVRQFQVLRDALAYLVGGDGERVELRTTPSRVERFRAGVETLGLARPGRAVRFAFRGQGYRIELQALERASAPQERLS